MATVTLDTVTRVDGIAGQYQLTAHVTYRFAPDSLTGVEPPAESTSATFVGSIYGAPVVMVTDTFGQTFVDDWRQYGDTLDESWLRAFFGVDA